MTQPFSPGGGNWAIGHDAASIARSQAAAAAPMSREEMERERFQRENRFEQLRAPGPDCSFSIDGQTFTSVRHQRYGWVWTLPSRLVNQYIHAREIQLGDGATLRLTLAPAPEISGITY
jgi:hypothetical protein